MKSDLHGRPTRMGSIEPSGEDSGPRHITGGRHIAFKKKSSGWLPQVRDASTAVTLVLVPAQMHLFLHTSAAQKQLKFDPTATQGRTLMFLCRAVT
jgi:hypothetical protein